MKILSNGSERLMLLSWEGILSWRRRLGEAGLLRGHVAPLLDDGLLDRSGVGSGPGADLLGDIHTLLDRGKLGHQLGHVLAGPLGLEGAGLLGGVLDNGLLLRIADLLSLLESTASGGAELPGLLGTSGDGGVLTDRLLGDAANLPGPFLQLVEEVYPEVSSLHFSSISVLQSTTSSSTSWTSCLVQHSDSYSVRQISGPSMSQSLRIGVLQISTVSLKAICSYSMKQLFLKFSSHSSSCWES